MNKKHILLVTALFAVVMSIGCGGSDKTNGEGDLSKTDAVSTE